MANLPTTPPSSTRWKGGVPAPDRWRRNHLLVRNLNRLGWPPLPQPSGCFRPEERAPHGQ